MTIGAPNAASRFRLQGAVNSHFFFSPSSPLPLPIGNATMLSADVPRLSYEARIVTAEGTFLDRGTSYVHVDRFSTDIGFPFANFTETFESSLAQPIRVPVSPEDCKGAGFRRFPGLGFKNPRDCIADVSAST